MGVNCSLLHFGLITWSTKSHDTVDGSEIPNNHLTSIKPVVNNGIHYHSLNWLAGFPPSTVLKFLELPKLATANLAMNDVPSKGFNGFNPLLRGDQPCETRGAELGWWMADVLCTQQLFVWDRRLTNTK